MISTSYGDVETGLLVLQNGMRALLERVSSATPASKYKAFKERTLALGARVAETTAKWSEKDFLGKPWLYYNPGIAYQQLQGWCVEHDALWQHWGKISGEPIPAEGKAVAQLAVRVQGGSISVTLVVIVALVVAGGVAVFYIWRK